MYISGENIVVKPYTPVDAYAVMPMADGITSGGNGGGNVIDGRTRFYWVYNPDSPDGSGFTGVGWFCGVEGTPLQGYATEEDFLAVFGTEKTDLNDEFAAWQEFVNNDTRENWLQNFMQMIVAAGDLYWNCFAVGA